MNLFDLVSQRGVRLAPDERWGITNLACDVSDPDKITFADGWGTTDHGSTLTASQILAPPSVPTYPEEWSRCIRTRAAWVV